MFLNEIAIIHFKTGSQQWRLCRELCKTFFILVIYTGNLSLFAMEITYGIFLLNNILKSMTGNPIAIYLPLLTAEQWCLHYYVFIKIKQISRRRKVSCNSETQKFYRMFLHFTSLSHFYCLRAYTWYLRHLTT